MRLSEPIPFNIPCQYGHEGRHLQDLLERGKFSNGGFYTQSCEDLLINYFGAEDVILTTSCTASLEMCALLLGIEPGDEVICPSYTFVSTINAFVLHGAVPVYVDIELPSCNLDISQIAPLITPKTKAILAVNYGGACCDLKLLRSLCDNHNIILIEDAAQSLGSSFPDVHSVLLDTCQLFHSMRLKISSVEKGVRW